MPDILLVKNILREGPGLLEAILTEHGLSYDLIDLEAGEVIPSSADYKAMIVFGGPDSANDTTSKMQHELAAVRQALEQNIPYLGICLGMQVLVKAAGGDVLSSPVKEVGFLDNAGAQCFVNVLPEAQTDPLLTGLPAKLHVFHLHGETVELTDSMQLLATGTHCRNQIVKVSNNAYGIQSHFELTSSMLAVWSVEDPDLVPIGSETLNKQFKAIQAEYTSIGQTLFANFLKLANLIN